MPFASTLILVAILLTVLRILDLLVDRFLLLLKGGKNAIVLRDIQAVVEAALIMLVIMAMMMMVVIKMITVLMLWKRSFAEQP